MFVLPVIQYLISLFYGCASFCSPAFRVFCQLWCNPLSTLHCHGGILNQLKRGGRETAFRGRQIIARELQNMRMAGGSEQRFLQVHVYTVYILTVGTAVAQWLRWCATNRKAAGSVPAGVSGFFIDTKSFRPHYGLGSTQPLTEMSTWIISWGKGDRCARLTILPTSCAVVMKYVNLNFLEPSGPLQACNGTALPLLYNSTNPD